MGSSLVSKLREIINGLNRQNGEMKGETRKNSIYSRKDKYTKFQNQESENVAGQ